MKLDSKRNYGIDALRILAMFFIAILHVFGHGGITTSLTGLPQYVAKFIGLAVNCAVDVYAIISGFVAYTDAPKKLKTSKFLTIWTQVFTYSFIIALGVFAISHVSPKITTMGLKELIRRALPITSNAYWYFSAYVPVLILAPWINKFLSKLSRKEATQLAATLFGTFSVFVLIASKIAPADAFSLGYGYSALWLLVLYVIGAWMKKCDVTSRIKTSAAWITLAVSVAITEILRLIGVGGISSYTSPTIVINALALVIIFAKWSPAQTATKLIKFFAPAAFGVYLIHDNDHIRSYLISRLGSWIVSLNRGGWLAVPIALAAALAILIVCLLIEKLRLTLFKVLRINDLINFVGGKIDNMHKKLEEKFNVLEEKENDSTTGS